MKRKLIPDYKIKETSRHSIKLIQAKGKLFHNTKKKKEKPSKTIE